MFSAISTAAHSSIALPRHPATGGTRAHAAPFPYYLAEAIASVYRAYVTGILSRFSKVRLTLKIIPTDTV